MYMADAKTIRKLDIKLIDDGVLSTDYKNEYKLVHNMLNTYQRKTGSILTASNFKQGEEKLRDWLMILNKKGADQKKLTNYLRCGLAHLSYDYISSNNKDVPDDELITRSLLSYKSRNFHKKFFKVAPLKKERTISIKKRNANK